MAIALITKARRPRHFLVIAHLIHWGVTLAKDASPGLVINGTYLVWEMSHSGKRENESDAEARCASKPL